MGKIHLEFIDNEEFIVLDDELLDNISAYEITNISLSRDTYYKTSNGIFIFKNTDYEHPLVLKKDWKDSSRFSLYINPEWYIEHEDLVNSLIIKIIKQSTNNEISIYDKCLINSQIIDELCTNDYFDKVSLGSIKEENGYLLTNDEYLKFKNSKIKKVETFGVCDELKENFDPLISCNSDKSLIASYTYSELSLNSPSSLFLHKRLTNEELDNLKYLNDTKVLKLSNECVNDFSIICGRLTELSKNNRVELNIENKNEFNQLLFNTNINYSNLFVCPNRVPISVKKYLELEKILYSMIEAARNLSPFEKYLYAYNIVKKFKEYNESTDDLKESRNLYKILENEYMVCVGFSNLFGDLLDKLGIENKELGIKVDISYDNVKSQEEIDTEEKILEYDGHSRRYVHIVDEKYGIDGYYVADPTWDNVLDKDCYNHAVMTDYEASTGLRYLKFSSDSSELFDVNSIEEFYNKINFILDKNQKNRKFGEKDLSDIVYSLVNILEKIDSNFISCMKAKYNFIGESKYKYPDDLTDLLFDLGNYIVNHVNKEINGETIMKAVEVIYRTTGIFPEDRINEELEKTKEINRERQVKCFPPRRKYYSDGHVEEDVNWYNKFDLDEHKKTM